MADDDSESAPSNVPGETVQESAVSGHSEVSRKKRRKVDEDDDGDGASALLPLPASVCHHLLLRTACKHSIYYSYRPSGLVAKRLVLGLRSKGRVFDSRSGCYQVVTTWIG